MTAAGPAVSVVIPLYQDEGSIGGVLAALARQEGTPDFEVIVVDDGSSDAGPAIAEAAGARVLRQANAGPSAARNAGARAARAPVILYLDADCVPPETWLREMAAPMTDQGFDAVVGTICPANDGVVPRLVQSEVADRYRSMARSGGSVDFIAAPSCGTTRALLDRLGGFDESLRQAEDVELGYRISTAGGRIAFVQAVPVAHHHQTGWGEFLRVKFRRALGRIEVLDRYPEKRLQDNWTPFQFKLQVALIGLAGLTLFATLVLASWTGLYLTLAMLAAAVLLGWPLVSGTAATMHGLVAWPLGHVIGSGFVLVRGAVIISAVLAHRLRRARWRGPISNARR
jgi:glycosyltransferase involved in cell wall biosynthesis